MCFESLIMNKTSLKIIRKLFFILIHCSVFDDSCENVAGVYMESNKPVKLNGKRASCLVRSSQKER